MLARDVIGGTHITRIVLGENLLEKTKISTSELKYALSNEIANHRICDRTHLQLITEEWRFDNLLLNC